eukprot:4345743-Lingulodinium_polyedra.AAC.1
MRRHAASSCLSLAAGPPLSATIQRLAPTGASSPAPSCAVGRSGTRAAGAGAPSLIQRYSLPAPP